MENRELFSSPRWRDLFSPLKNSDGENRRRPNQVHFTYLL